MTKRDEMIAFATERHAGQFRKFGLSHIPYVIHPIEVSDRVARLAGATEAMVVAALAHDLIEDTATTRAEIAERFGEGVADLVVELTDHYTPETHPGLSRRERKALENARQAAMSREAKLIKLADVANNLGNMIPVGYAASGGEISFGGLFIREKDAILAAIGGADAELRAEVAAASDGLAERLALADAARKARKLAGA